MESRRMRQTLALWIIGMMLVLSAWPAFAAEGATSEHAPAWMYLRTRRMDDRGDGYSGLLIREIVRQAVLISARDEFGLPTRDASLNEPVPTDSQTGRVLDALVRVGPKQGEPAFNPMQLRLPQVGEHGWSVVAHLPTSPAPQSIDYMALTDHAEHWSRNQIRDALQQAGFKGEANRRNPDAPLPEAVADNFYTLHAYAQYDLVRQCHKAMRDQGESPAVLGGLVRGYATMGQLTRMHWDISEEVFYARALLYADRWIALYGKTPAALRHRAYARAMAGFDGPALDDLQAASAIKDAPPAPLWAKLIGAYARYDTTFLEQVGDSAKPEKKLARYLRFLLAERQSDPLLSMRYGQAVLEAAPGCTRVAVSIATEGGLHNQRVAGSAGAKGFFKIVPKYLASIPDLPEAAQQANAQFMQAKQWPTPASARVVKSLTEAADPSDDQDAAEPSWAVLGRLVDETNFELIFRDASFMKFTWDVDIDPFVTQAMPSLSEHPCAPVIEALNLDPKGQADQINQLITQIDWDDLHQMHGQLFDNQWWGMWPKPTQFRRQLWSRLYASCDRNTHNLCYWLSAYDYGNAEERQDAAALKFVSPHSRVAVAALVRSDWARVKKKADQWRQDYRDSPIVLEELAMRYLDDKKPEQAEITLKALIKVSHKAWGYQRLAELYRKQLEMQKWRSILEQYLAEGEDTGLTKAWVRKDISKFYRQQNQFEKALPFAKQAAQTWAAWAMIEASNVYEAMHQWDKAEVWIRRTSERYPEESIDWYLWCRRTGRGDLDAAPAHASGNPAASQHPEYRTHLARRLVPLDGESTRQSPAQLEGVLGRQPQSGRRDDAGLLRG